MYLYRLVTLLLTLALSPTIALGQAQPTGTFTPGHALRANTASGSPYSDAGGAAGSEIFGTGYLTELGITNTGLPFCINDALTSDMGGYHRTCLAARSSNWGGLTYDALGGASALPFNFTVNGLTSLWLNDTGANVTTPDPDDSSDRIPNTAWVQGLVGSAGVSSLPIIATNGVLAATPISLAGRVMRMGVAAVGDAAPLIFISQNDTCTTNGLVNNIGNCVDSSDGNSWVAKPTAGVIDVRQFGATGDGTTDDAAAIQAAFDTGGGNPSVVTIPPGSYGVGSSVHPLPNTRLVMAGGAELKKLGSGYCALLAVDAVGNTFPRDSVTGIDFVNLTINNNGLSGCALMLDSVRGGFVGIKSLYGGATTGTWTYQDNYSTGSYPNALLMLKGTQNVDNTASVKIVTENIGNISRPSYTCPTYSGVGIWLGASAGDVTAHNPPNNNQFFSGQIYCNTNAVEIDYGSDNSFYSMDFSLNSGWVARIGNGVTAYRANRRNYFFKPYMEANTIGGVFLASNATYNTVLDPASTAGTPSSLLFDDTHGGSNNKWCDNKTCYVDTVQWTTRAPVGTPIPNPIIGAGLLFDGNDNGTAAYEARAWSNGSSLILSRANGTHDAPSQVLINQQLGEVDFRARDDVAFVTGRQAGLRVIATEDQTATGHGTRLRFFTTPNGATTSVDGFNLEPDGGVTVGASGSAGAGTINAQGGFYDNSVRVFTPCANFTNINEDTAVSGITHGQLFRVNLSSIAITMTMPATPDDGDEYCFVDQRGLAATHNLTINGNGNNIFDAATYVISTNYASIRLSWSAASGRWISIP